MKLIGPDFYNISDLLNEEELFIQKTAHDFVSNEFKPIINEHFEKGTFPLEIATKLGELGFMGSALPEESGGAGVSNVAYGLIAREIERVDSSYRSAFSVQSSLAMYAIYKFGSEQQKEHFIPEMAKGNVIGCFGLTEPDYGSNPGGMVTKAEKVDGGYILNGAKMWITNGTVADIAIVWAKLDGVIRGFIVEKDDEGFSAPEQKGKHSLRASVTSELVLQDVLLYMVFVLGGLFSL